MHRKSLEDISRDADRALLEAETRLDAPVPDRDALLASAQRLEVMLRELRAASDGEFPGHPGQKIWHDLGRFLRHQARQAGAATRKLS